MSREQCYKLEKELHELKQAIAVQQKAIPIMKYKNVLFWTDDDKKMVEQYIKDTHKYTEKEWTVCDKPIKERTSEEQKNVEEMVEKSLKYNLQWPEHTINYIPPKEEKS